MSHVLGETARRSTGDGDAPHPIPLPPGEGGSQGCSFSCRSGPSARGRRSAAVESGERSSARPREPLAGAPQAQIPPQAKPTLGIPEVAGEAQSGEDLPHLRGFRPARIGLKPRRVPRLREAPELVHPDERPHRDSLRLAPFPDSFFRPEEQHRASRENNVVPPVSRGNEAVEQPVGALRSVE